MGPWQNSTHENKGKDYVQKRMCDSAGHISFSSDSEQTPRLAFFKKNLEMLLRSVCLSALERTIKEGNYDEVGCCRGYG